MTDPTASAAGPVLTTDVVDHAAGIIGFAFADLPLSEYLMPGTDRITKIGILAGHLRHTIATAQQHGRLETDPDNVGAAAWLDLTHGPLPPDIGYEQQRAAACGIYADRFARFEDAMHEHHQRNVGGLAHWHLALLGVVPARQHGGLGSALLRHHLQVLDTAHAGCYVEASSTRSRDLYLRHGFLAVGDRYPAGPDGPSMYPLWRAPGAPSHPTRGRLP